MERVTLQYAGNLGRVQGLMEFLDCVNDANNDNLNIDFWGTGAMESKMVDFIESHKLSNTRMCGKFTRSQQNEVVASCDICLITLGEGMYGLGVPSKSYNIMAAGKPILYIGPHHSELDLLIKEHNIGWSFQPSDKDGIVQFLHNISPSMKSELKEKGEVACTLASSQFSKERILQEFYDYL